MNSPDRLAALGVNPDWAKLPLFDRSKWKRVRFGDVVRASKDEVDPTSGDVDRYVAGEHMESENIHIRKWGTVGDGYLGPAFHRQFRKGQVLYGSRRTYLKKVAVAEWDGVTANTTFVLETIADRMLQEFLPWLMLSERFTKHSVQESKGSTNPYINWPDIAKFEFDLPPLEQQARISHTMGAIDTVWVATRRVSCGINDCRQALLDSLGRSYANAHALVELDSVIEKGRPICYGILKPGLGVPDGIPVIKVRDYPSGRVETERLLLTTAEIEAPFRRSRLKGGDLLLSIRGTVGRLAEVPPSLEGANVTQDTARLAIASTQNREYIRAVLESRFLQNQIASRVTGLAVKGINIGEVRKLRIPLPPRREQDRIAAQVREISMAIAQADNNADALRQVLFSLGSKVFGAVT